MGLTSLEWMRPEPDRWFGPAPPPPPEAPDASRTGRLARALQIVLVLDLMVLAVGAVAAALQGAEAARRVVDVDRLRVELWTTTLFSFLALTIVPVAWAFATRRRAWGAMLRLRLDRPGPSLLLALPLLLGIYLVVVAVAGLAMVIDEGLLENPVVEGLGPALSWPLVVAIALAAGIGEEILFRGLLQRWVGVVPQALLFAFLHMGYGTELQVLVPLLMGLLLGYVVKRGWGLWAAIGAHFLYDLVALSLLRTCALEPGLRICG